MFPEVIPILFSILMQYTKLANNTDTPKFVLKDYTQFFGTKTVKLPTKYNEAKRRIDEENITIVAYLHASKISLITLETSIENPYEIRVAKDSMRLFFIKEGSDLSSEEIKSVPSEKNIFGGFLLGQEVTIKTFGTGDPLLYFYKEHSITTIKELILMRWNDEKNIHEKHDITLNQNAFDFYCTGSCDVYEKLTFSKNTVLRYDTVIMFKDLKLELWAWINIEMKAYKENDVLRIPKGEGKKPQYSPGVTGGTSEVKDMDYSSGSEGNPKDEVKDGSGTVTVTKENKPWWKSHFPIIALVSIVFVLVLGVGAFSFLYKKKRYVIRKRANEQSLPTPK